MSGGAAALRLPQARLQARRLETLASL